MYIDDYVVAVKGEDNAIIVSKQVKKDLLNAGRVINSETSQWAPEKCITWLGFELEMERGQLRVPEWKLTALHGWLHETRKRRHIPAKCLVYL